MNAIRPPGWMAQGLCTQVDPELFYPGEGGQAREALRVCAGCPVRAQCLAYALDRGERFGIWGGQSAAARRRMTRPAPQPAPASQLVRRAAQIRRLTAAGLSDREVGARIGCTTRTVHRIRARFEIPPARGAA